MSQRVTIPQALDLAREAHRSGRLQETETICRKILSEHPNEPESLHLLGIVASQVGRLDLAAQLIGLAIQNDPESSQFYFNLGLVQASADKLDAAIDAFQTATLLDPGSIAAWFNLGNTLQDAGQPDAAINAYRSLIRVEENHVDAHINLGAILLTSGKLEEAIQILEKAILLNPNVPEAHSNLGQALTEADQTDRAIHACRRALELNPNYAEAHSNLGAALIGEGKIDAAWTEYRRAVELKPDFALAHCNLGAQMLLHGDIQNGWRELEWRCDRQLGKVCQQFPQPRWDGSDLNGKRILIDAEQGFGDTIQLARYIPLVKSRGGIVVFQCQPELVMLFSKWDQADEIIPRGDPLPAFDLHYPLFSVPVVFKTQLQTIPSKTLYLAADPIKAERWRERISEHSRDLKVGVVWAGRSEHKNDRNRSISPAIFESFAKVHGVRLFSLQIHSAKPHDIPLVDWTMDLSDFSETAALIENLDLVISVDTAVAHLAGAMGKPVWLLVPFVPDWRWLLDRSDSPWYPTMRLFRQEKLGDWSYPISAVVQSLQKLAENQRV